MPCRHADRELGADVLILDDGFQHLAVRRDIDFVLFDATFLAGNSRIFPGGPLREPVSSLKRCDAFIVTGLHENNAERAKKFRELLSDRFPGKPVFSAFQGEPELVDRAGNRSAALPGKQYYAICGIANPARFSESLKRLGVKLCGVHNLRDHAAYSQILMTRICSEAAAAGADSLVTTNKDYVKMQTLDVELPVYVLDPGFTMEDGFSSFLMERLDVLQPRAEP
jgi:tetraacyldisaccharide 4'-kinase